MLLLSIAEMGVPNTSTAVLFAYLNWMIRPCFTDKVVRRRTIASVSDSFPCLSTGWV